MFIFYPVSLRKYVTKSPFRFFVPARGRKMSIFSSHPVPQEIVLSFCARWPAFIGRDLSPTSVFDYLSCDNLPGGCMAAQSVLCKMSLYKIRESLRFWEGKHMQVVFFVGSPQPLALIPGPTPISFRFRFLLSFPLSC